jgi:hypothetical protein
MVEWKESARKEVIRLHAIDNVACVTHASRKREMMRGDQVFVGVGDAL